MIDIQELLSTTKPLTTLYWSRTPERFVDQATGVFVRNSGRINQRGNSTDWNKTFLKVFESLCNSFDPRFEGSLVGVINSSSEDLLLVHENYVKYSANFPPLFTQGKCIGYVEDIDFEETTECPKDMIVVLRLKDKAYSVIKIVDTP